MDGVRRASLHGSYGVHAACKLDNGWNRFEEVHHYGGMLSAARPANTCIRSNVPKPDPLAGLAGWAWKWRDL